MDRARLASVGVVGAAIGSVLCCLGPLVAVSLGVSGAWLAGTFDPLRPYLLGATAFLIAGGHYVNWREGRRACVPGSICASPVARRRMKWWMWIATAIAVPLATYPWWAGALP